MSSSRSTRVRGPTPKASRCCAPEGSSRPSTAARDRGRCHARTALGHTHHSTAVRVVDGSDEALFVGHLFLHPAQVHRYDRVELETDPRRPWPPACASSTRPQPVAPCSTATCGTPPAEASSASRATATARAGLSRLASCLSAVVLLSSSRTCVAKAERSRRASPGTSSMRPENSRTEHEHLQRVSSR